MKRTNTPELPPIPSALAQSAMLANLDVHVWQGRKTDRRATRELHAQHQARERAGNYRKALMGECGPLKTVLDHAAEANTTHRNLTAPWQDDGWRILAAAGFLHYKDVMGKVEAAFTTAWRAFVKEYPALIVEAEKDLGTLYNIADYPDPKNISKKFGFDIAFRALPVASDFRVNIKDDEAKLIRDQIEASTREGLHNAFEDLYGRVSERVEHMAERLRAYKMTETGIVGKFHDTLVKNVEDIAEMLPLMDIAGDGRMSKLADRLKGDLLEFSAQELRSSKSNRTEIARRAQSILKTMQEIAA